MHFCTCMYLPNKSTVCFSIRFPSLASCSAPVLVIPKNQCLSFCVLSGLRRSTTLTFFKMNCKAFSLGGHKNVRCMYGYTFFDCFIISLLCALYVYVVSKTNLSTYPSSNYHSAFPTIFDPELWEKNLLQIIDKDTMTQVEHLLSSSSLHISFAPNLS